MRITGQITNKIKIWVDWTFSAKKAGEWPRARVRDRETLRAHEGPRDHAKLNNSEFRLSSTLALGPLFHLKEITKWMNIEAIDKKVSWIMTRESSKGHAVENTWHQRLHHCVTATYGWAVPIGSWAVRIMLYGHVINSFPWFTFSKVAWKNCLYFRFSCVRDCNPGSIQEKFYTCTSVFTCQRKNEFNKQSTETSSMHINQDFRNVHWTRFLQARLIST